MSKASSWPEGTPDGHNRYVLSLPRPGDPPLPLVVIVNDDGEIVDQWVARDWADVDVRRVQAG